MVENYFKILLIEDEELLGELLVKKIKAEGYYVEWIKDGQQGLEKARNKKFDLILLDMILPSLDGFGVLEGLKESKNKTPIIIISNSGQTVDVDRAMDLGAIDYLVKSDFDPRDVIRKIREHLSLSNEKNLGQSGGKLVLVVEDDQFLRELITKKLINNNYNTITAIDGHDGLQVIEEQKPSLVLLDIMMPGMDGFEVLREVRGHADKQVAKTPIIMLSNLGQEENVTKAKDLGANDYVIKANFSTDEILQKIEYFIKETKG